MLIIISLFKIVVNNYTILDQNDSFMDLYKILYDYKLN